MAQYTDNNGIKYNNAIGGAPMPKINNQSNDYTDLEAGVAYIVNAIEIDWNGANLGSYIINTTGQLLSYMSTISEKIANLENILIKLDNY